MKLTLADIARALGRDIPADAAVASVHPAGGRTDSREVRAGDLFFCIKGERADGHDFAAVAAKAGASAIIVERPVHGVDQARTPVFLVEDSVKALGRVARLHRLGASATVLGITGTAGKTTVKETLAQILETAGPTARNPLNLNNQIGLPLSMLNADEDAVFWVMEAGISQPHDMDELGGILQPDAALVLNAGPGHLSGLGDKGPAHYKARLLDYIRPGGQAFVSADYPDFSLEAERRMATLSAQGVRVSTFSADFDSNADCRARHLGGNRFEACLDGQSAELTAPFTGAYGAENVAAVWLAALRLGLLPEAAAAALAQVRLPAMRFAPERVEDFTLINDSYNSNPLSAARMIEAAAGMAGEHSLPLILVMGDMLELGGESVREHVEMGRKIGRLKPVHLFWKGLAFEHVGRGLSMENFTGGFTPVSGQADFLQSLKQQAFMKGLVLFKGSRGNKLEELVQAFRGWACRKERVNA